MPTNAMPDQFDYTLEYMDFLIYYDSKSCRPDIGRSKLT